MSMRIIVMSLVILIIFYVIYVMFWIIHVMCVQIIVMYVVIHVMCGVITIMFMSSVMMIVMLLSDYCHVIDSDYRVRVNYAMSSIVIVIYVVVLSKPRWLSLYMWWHYQVVSDPYHICGHHYHILDDDNHYHIL